MDAAADLGSGLANEALAFRLHGEVLNVGDGAFATRDPGDQQLGVGRLAAGRVGAFAGGFTGADGLNNPAKRRINIVDLAEDDQIRQFGGLVGADGDLRGSLGRRVGSELAKELAEADQTLEVGCVGKDCGFRRRLNRAFEPHLDAFG